MVSSFDRLGIEGRPELIDVKTRKCAVPTSRRTAAKRSRPQPDQRQEIAVSSSPVASDRPSSHDTTVASDTDTDTATEIIDHRYLALRQAITVLNDQSQLWIGGEVATEGVHRQATAIWAAIRSASESYERCFDYWEHTEALLVMRKQIYVVNAGLRRHHHELTRPARMMRIVVNVLRTTIFEADLPSQLQQLSPLPTSLNLLHQVAPALHQLVEIRHGQQQCHRLHEVVLQACEDAFARDLGAYSHDCMYFLRHAVSSALHLHFQMRHPQRPYEFVWDHPVASATSSNRIRQRRDDQGLIFPAMRRGRDIVVPAEFMPHRRDCGRCLEIS